jgi:hypothetical protein
MAPLTNNENKPPLLPMAVMNRFERTWKKKWSLDESSKLTN